MEADNQQFQMDNDGESQEQIESQNDPYIEGDDEEEDLMDEDQEENASSDSQLQVNDPSQNDGYLQENDQIQEIEEPSSMDRYLKKEQQVLEWVKNHPGQKWVDFEFQCNSSQFYDDPANLPEWGSTLKNIQWKRPDQIIKDPKFMISEEGKTIDVDAKHGIFATSWFIGALTIIGTKSVLIEKLIVERQYFDKGFVTFQFFKNGQWNQVIVDTLLPYEKEQNVRICLYSSCTNPQQFWIQLMEKAYVKIHKNYQRITKGTVMEGLVDLTGGVSEILELSEKEGQKIDNNQIWNALFAFHSQKFLLGCMNFCDSRSAKSAQQGQQGILENHYYGIIDMRDFPKDNLKLIRIRNPWGNEGVWTGPFCQEADDWEKYKIVKEELKNVPKTKKADGSWWMSFTDFMMQFDRVFIGKVFPDAWETYSIAAQWHGKTNGGKCPTNIIGDKNHNQTTNLKDHYEYIQTESDDRWFNNPQFRVKVSKDTKIYISLMQEDEKISNQAYVPVSFMIISTKSKTERIWQRPPENQIIAQINASGAITSQRQITHYLTLKKFEGKNFGIYMIIPNIAIDAKESKKDESRKFYLRLFSPDTLDVTQMSETLETTVEGQWTESSAGGSRRIQIRQEGKKKGDIKQNPNWCKNPQYFLSLKQPTMMKIILRKGGFKKFKGWKIGMTICRFEGADIKQIEKDNKKQKGAGHNNLKRLIQQTSQYLQPPILSNIQRKLSVKPHEKFKQSCYFSEDVSALYFKYNPTEGPFIIVPSSDGEERLFGYKLTIFSNNPVDLQKLDDSRNQVVIGKWEQGISAGGCHLNQKQKQPSHRTWSMNPKYLLHFKEDEASWLDPLNVKITLAIAQKNWKKLNPNTVSGMIGIYLMDKQEGKIHYSEDIIVSQTNFLPVKQTSMELTLGGPERPINKDGYIIMPSTYEAKAQGSFIISVKANRPFELAPYK